MAIEHAPHLPAPSEPLGRIPAWASITGAVLVLAGGAYLISRFVPLGSSSAKVTTETSDPNKSEPVQAVLPINTRIAQVERTPTTIPTPTEVPATATPEPTPTREVKPIPDVITLASLEQTGRGIVVWTPEQIEAARAEAVQRGEIKFPLPKVLFDMGGILRIDPEKRALIITDIDPNKPLELSALIEGEVLKAGRGNAQMNFINIRGLDKKIYTIIIPLVGSNIWVKAGEQVAVDTKVVTVNSNTAFENAVKNARYPANARAIIGVANSDNSALPNDIRNILTDENGNIVVVELPSLTMNPTKHSVVQQLHPELYTKAGYPKIPPTKV